VPNDSTACRHRANNAHVTILYISFELIFEVGWESLGHSLLYQPLVIGMYGALLE
jgi:hypothetical protein